MKLKEEDYLWSKINVIMEYRKIVNLLENTPNQPTKCRTKILFEINNNSRGLNNTKSQIKFKTLMLRWRLCDYRDAYVLVRGAITILKQEIMMQRDD